MANWIEVVTMFEAWLSWVYVHCVWTVQCTVQCTVYKDQTFKFTEIKCFNLESQRVGI